MRQGELIGLQWQDIDFKHGLISVKRSVKELSGQLIVGEPKTSYGKRTIAIPQSVSKELQEHQQKQLNAGMNSEWVFTDTKGGIVRAQNLYNKSFKPLLKKAKLPSIRFHDLRHTHASLLLQQGVNPKVIQERLGHSTINLTLDTYSHVLPNMQKQVVKELDVLFG